MIDLRSLPEFPLSDPRSADDRWVTEWVSKQLALAQEYQAAAREVARLNEKVYDLQDTVRTVANGLSRVVYSHGQSNLKELLDTLGRMIDRLNEQIDV